MPRVDHAQFTGRRMRGGRKPLTLGRTKIVVLIFGCLFLGLVAPVLTLVIFGFFIFSGARRSSIAGVATGVTVAAFFGWMNAQKEIVGDWVWYTEHYRLLQHLSLADYLGHYIVPFQIKWSEPVYYSGAFALTRITHGSISALAVVVTASIYLPLTLGINTMLAKSALRPVERSFVVLMALLGGVTFTLTTQLVRQEIASAFLALAILQYVYGRHKLGVLLAAVAVLTHNSSLAPLAACLVAAAYVAPSGKILRIRFAIAGGAFIFVGFVAAHALSTQGYDPLSKNDGSIGLLVFAADAALLLVFVRLRESMSWLGPLHAFLVVALSLHVAFTLSLVNEPVPFLRMYFYVEVFRAIMIAAITVTLIRRKSLAVVAVPALALMLIYCELRITRAPYSYGGGIVQHLFAPLLL